MVPLVQFKNMKNTHAGVLLFECFSRFLNCANNAKSRKASEIVFY